MPKINIDFDILSKLMPHAFRMVNSDCRHILLIVITDANSTLIGIVITITAGKLSIIIIKAIFIGIPYDEICFISVRNVSEAKMIEVKTITPSINT